MASNLEAIIAHSQVLKDLPFDLTDSRVVQLGQGLAMIPYTEELQKSFGVEFDGEETIEPISIPKDEEKVIYVEPHMLYLIEDEENDETLDTTISDDDSGLPGYLTETLESTLMELSQRGAVAYVESWSFGGEFHQYSIVWENGQILFGPVINTNAVNQALHILATTAESGDEFYVISPTERRYTEYWLIDDENWDTERERPKSE